MVKCPSITAKGTACKGFVKPGDTYCAQHDPEQSERRRRDASRAARFKAQVSGLEDYEWMKKDLKQLYLDVKAGRANRSNASVAAQVAGVWTKIAEAEIKLRQFEQIDLVEFQELREEVKALKQRAEDARVGGGGRWRA